jgi:hypothetical protein
MEAMAQHVSQVTLETSEANRLGKWGSLWFDLQHVVMALGVRRNTPNTFENAFARRALWESAVVSYGRMEASSHKRKLTHEELLRASGGDEAVAFHKQVMRRRNDHIAHRLSKEFESVEVSAHYSDDEPKPERLGLMVSTWVGPKDDALEATHFREHVTRLRDTLWEKYLAPIGQAIADRERVEIPVEPDSERDDTDRIAANLTLWDRVNGTGL